MPRPAHSWYKYPDPDTRCLLRLGGLIGLRPRWHPIMQPNHLVGFPNLLLVRQPDHHQPTLDFVKLVPNLQVGKTSFSPRRDVPISKSVLRSFVLHRDANLPQLFLQIYSTPNTSKYNAKYNYRKKNTLKYQQLSSIDFGQMQVFSFSLSSPNTSAALLIQLFSGEIRNIFAQDLIWWM